MKVTVIQTIQSGTNEPVEIRWTTNDTPLGAAAAVASILHAAESPGPAMPESIRPRLLSIRVEITHEESA